MEVDHGVDLAAGFDSGAAVDVGHADGVVVLVLLAHEAVLADGTIVNTLAVPRHASGPDLSQLFLGSEGTFGVMTDSGPGAISTEPDISWISASIPFSSRNRFRITG